MRCIDRILPAVVLAVLWAGGSAANAWDTEPAPRGAVTVNVVTKTTFGDGKSGGNCLPVRVTAEASADGLPRVGFFETHVQGTGSQWRASGWMAAVTAGVLSDFDPRTTRVSFEYGGIIDGPSAGGALTIGILAAARGDTIRPDAAMTGTINPDGSIGTVGGITHKIDGAAKKGMKLLLIPAGVRFDTDSNTGEEHDLVEYGQQQGVEVRNVFNIYQAYRLLTGQPLPRPDSPSAPRVSADVQRRVKQKIVAWVKRYQHARARYDDMPGTDKNSEDVQTLYGEGLDRIKQSTILVSEGEFTAGMWDCVVGAAYSYLGLETARCRYTYATRGYAGLMQRLGDNEWLAKDVREMSRRMRRETPRTLEQLSVYLIACDTFMEGVSLQILAAAILSTAPDEDSELGLEMAAKAAHYQILAWLDMKLAGDYLDLVEAYGGTPIPSDVPWRETANHLYHASQANMAVFDAVIIEPVAKAQSVSAQDVRNQMLIKDQAYGILKVGSEGVFPNLSKYFGDGEAMLYADLAASVYRHTRTAGLLAKHYSLAADLDEYAEVVSIPHERVLGQWLTYAEDQSRRNIGMLQDSGVDATACAQMHSIARIKARRDLHEKLEGLVEFWSADVHARILRRLSGLAATQAQPPAAEPRRERDAAALPNSSK